MLEASHSSSVCQSWRVLLAWSSTRRRLYTSHFASCWERLAYWCWPIRLCQLGKVNTNVGLKKIVEGAYLVPLGSANAVLLDGGPELALVDAGFPDKATFVFHCDPAAWTNIARSLTPDFHARSSRPHWQRGGDCSGNRRDHLHARAGRPSRRNRWPLPPQEPGWPQLATYPQSPFSGPVDQLRRGVVPFET